MQLKKIRWVNGDQMKDHEDALSTLIQGTCINHLICTWVQCTSYYYLQRWIGIVADITPHQGR